MKLKKFKKSYNESIEFQLSMYAVDDAFRCIEFIVRDCCWQCGNSVLRFLYPTRKGRIEIDSFLKFCRDHQPDYGRPKTEKTAMEYADSFEILTSRLTLKVISEKAKWVRGDG